MATPGLVVTAPAPVSSASQIRFPFASVFKTPPFEKPAHKSDPRRMLPPDSWIPLAKVEVAVVERTEIKSVSRLVNLVEVPATVLVIPPPVRVRPPDDLMPETWMFPVILVEVPAVK